MRPCGFWDSLTEQSNRYGIPVLAEMMPSMDAAYDPTQVAHAARIGYEMGADIVKTNYCGEIETFKHVVRIVACTNCGRWRPQE